MKWTERTHDKLHKSFPKLRWQYNNGILYAKDFISRKFFGNFNIYFEQHAKNGKVVVSIKNMDCPSFNRNDIEYENFEKAVEGLNAYFGDIREKQKSIPLEVEFRAKQAYQKIIADEIAKMIGGK